jgi:glycosyltransferase involved in cell wall biosynthesis
MHKAENALPVQITLLSTSDIYGGAAIAGYRLFKALRKNRVQAHLLVQNKLTKDEEVITISQTYWQQKKTFLRFALDRLLFLPYEKDKGVRFAFSPGNVGINLAEHPLVRQADVINLHWINFGFLSLRSIRQLAKLNKPIVWTFHDMWAFTGGCHYSGDCTHYRTHCHDCPFLRNPGPRDLSFRVFKEKIKTFAHLPLTVVTSSEWLAGLARESALLKSFRVQSIPIPIDTQVYQPLDQSECRRQLGLPADKKLILFGAMNTRDTRKGFAYLAEALEQLKDQKDVELVVFGKADEQTLKALPLKVNYLGAISQPEKLVPVYNAADVFVLPSLEDNLPNTVIESLACGTPVVGFRMGGLPEMVEHRVTGYVADFKSATDLAKGIGYVLFEADAPALRTQARAKALRDYSEEVVTARYYQLYAEVVK